jgi:hypothetical protein
MSIKLNSEAITYAKKLIHAGEIDHNAHDWQEVKPTHDEVSKFLNTHSLEEYGVWFLGINTGAPASDKSHYCFPIGDFKLISKAALKSVAHDAAAQGLTDIAAQAQELISSL